MWAWNVRFPDWKVLNLHLTATNCITVRAAGYFSATGGAGRRLGTVCSFTAGDELEAQDDSTTNWLWTLQAGPDLQRFK